MKNYKKNIPQVIRLGIVLCIVSIFTILFFSCGRGCDDPIYFTLINKSSEKIKFITWGWQNKEYVLKSGKSINFDSYPPQTNLKILPKISKIEIIILSNGKTIKDSCDFTKANTGYCEADRGFFDRKSYFYRENKFNGCGWYQYVFTDEDVKRAK